MTERGETIAKHGVIFVIFDGKNIQLEKRIEKNKKYYGYVLIPGGGVEQGESPQSALIREVREEYEAMFIQAKELGAIETVEEDGQLNYRHVFLVDEWKGRLLNPEHKNIHLKATLEEARELCKHPVSQLVLDMVEKELSGQNC